MPDVLLLSAGDVRFGRQGIAPNWRHQSVHPGDTLSIVFGALRLGESARRGLLPAILDVAKTRTNDGSLGAVLSLVPALSPRPTVAGKLGRKFFLSLPGGSALHKGTRGGGQRAAGFALG